MTFLQGALCLAATVTAIARRRRLRKAAPLRPADHFRVIG